MKDAAPQLKKAASVCGEFSRLGNKRSRSSEDLAAISEMTPPVKKIVTPSTTGAATHREVSPEPKSPASLKMMFRAREKAYLSRQKPPKSPKSPKSEEIEAKPKKKAASPKHSARGKTGKSPPESPKSKQKGFQRFFERSKSPSPTPSSEDEERGAEKVKQTRMKRSVEGPRKHEEKSSGHPLSVAKQAKASSASQPQPQSTEAVQSSKNEAKTTVLEEPATASVADIVKRLNPQQQQPSVEQPAEKSKKKEKEKKEKGKKEAKKEEKEKQPLKASSAAEKTEKEGASKSRRFLSIFKPKKSYNVSKASSRSTKTSSSSPKLKKKKKTDPEREKLQQLSEKPQLSLQQRIKRLEELGVGKLDTDGAELVLSLVELRELELSRGLVPDEDGAEREEREVCVRGKSPAGQSEDGLESEQSNRSRSSTPLYSSGAEVESSGAATYGTSSRGVSPVGAEWRVGSPSGGEEASGEEPGEDRESVREIGEDGEFVMERTPSVVETVRQLEPLSAAYSVSIAEIPVENLV